MRILALPSMMHLPFSVTSSTSRSQVSLHCLDHQCLHESDWEIVSDLIALGTVVATAACGGPLVEFRAGRVDATQAGPSGVPRPETDLTDTLNQLSNAGFNEDDTITLTACGHTMGGYVETLGT